MAENNATILNSIWLNGTTDYQQRIPKCTQGDITQTVQALNNPANKPYWNEFVDALVNRIGLVVINGRVWENPLAPLKRGKLDFGDTIEEVGYKLLPIHGYDPEAMSLLRQEKPEFMSAFHKVNREDRIDMTVNQIELRKAFTDEYGLNNFVNRMMDIPLNTDNTAEYEIMKNLLPTYEKEYGFFKVNTPDLLTSQNMEQDSKTFLRNVRTMTGKMKFMKPYYNAYGLPVFSRPEDLILFSTPEVFATIDVEALAGAFNVSYAYLNTRTIVLDEMPIDGCQAILADRDWFMCYDYLYENSSFYNPQTLATNYYLHHWGVYSVSPMMNAIMLTTEANTSMTTVDVTFTGITLDYATVNGTKPEFAPKGEVTQLEATPEGTVTPADKGVHVPKGAYLEIVASDVETSPHTYVRNNGKLYVAEDEKATNVTVRVTSTYLDPDAKISGQTYKTADLVVGIGAKYTPTARTAKAAVK